MGRRSTTQQSFRRLNHAVDHSERNKRRVFAVIASAVVILAVAALALALAPLFSS
ncbi:hypothetical protein [Arthrobacter alpinus]|uniref:hypothetical protein n=1 Tax=Arthrobacter alpinus TaxID=656366 RepID=UPI0016465A77|nr:hypothetical protein [Arthrobacter alpinus]